MQRLVIRDVPHCHPLNRLVNIFVLPDTPNRHPKAIVEDTILDQDISRIRLEAYTVIPVNDLPILERDIRTVDRVRPICILRRTTISSIIDIDIGESRSLRVNDRECPKRLG